MYVAELRRRNLRATNRAVERKILEIRIGWHDTTVRDCFDGFYTLRTRFLESSIPPANVMSAGKFDFKGYNETYRASSTGKKQSRRHVRHVSPRAASSVATQAYDAVSVSRRILDCRWRMDETMGTGHRTSQNGSAGMMQTNAHAANTAAQRAPQPRQGLTLPRSWLNPPGADGSRPWICSGARGDAKAWDTIAKKIKKKSMIDGVEWSLMEMISSGCSCSNGIIQSRSGE